MKNFDPELRKYRMKESYDDTLDIDAEDLAEDELDYYAIEEEVRDFEQKMRNRLNIPSDIIDAYCDLFPIGHCMDLTEVLFGENGDEGLLGSGWKNPPTEEWLVDFCKEFIRYAFSALGKTLISTKKITVEKACDLLKDKDVHSDITSEDFVDIEDIGFIDKNMPFKVVKSNGYYFLAEPINSLYTEYYNRFEDKTF